METLRAIKKDLMKGIEMSLMMVRRKKPPSVRQMERYLDLNLEIRKGKEMYLGIQRG